MILGHFDKNFKRVGTTIDAHTLMIIRASIMLLILILPIYPLIYLYMRFSKEVGFKEWPTIAKFIANLILFLWFFILIGYQVSKDTKYPFYNGDTWIYNDHETGEKIIQYKGIDY